jgi:sporulation protein YlmC with PRC-barrel domain
MDESTFEYWRDRKVVDLSGEKIGSIEDVYVDEATGRREWLIVSTGIFRRSAVIPAQDIVTLDDDTVQVPFDRQQVKDSPHMNTDGELSEQEERDLYSYYGIPFSKASSPSIYAVQGLANARLRKRAGTEAAPKADPEERGEPVLGREPIAEEETVSEDLRGDEMDVDRMEEERKRRAA